ncbi:MAG: hypothetical protein PHD19_11740 [Dechloromonas sp.]|nr:hypothetical protein [Dechloromonas sp.]
MKPASIPLKDIARFSADAQVWRSFGRFIAVQNGALLAVPDVLVSGDFTAARDGCPVSWHEVLTAVDTPISANSRGLSPEQLADSAPLVAALFPPWGWAQDAIALCAGGRAVARVISPDGVIFCWVPDQD